MEKEMERTIFEQYLTSIKNKTGQRFIINNYIYIYIKYYHCSFFPPLPQEYHNGTSYSTKEMDNPGGTKRTWWASFYRGAYPEGWWLWSAGKATRCWSEYSRLPNPTARCECNLCLIFYSLPSFLFIARFPLLTTCLLAGLCFQRQTSCCGWIRWRWSGYCRGV